MKELDKEMNKILAEDIRESARYRPFVYGSKNDRLSDLCTHEWKETKHDGFNWVCVKCNLLRTFLSLADEPRCKGCKLLYAVESSIHPDYCDDCFKDIGTTEPHSEAEAEG